MKKYLFVLALYVLAPCCVHAQVINSIQDLFDKNPEPLEKYLQASIRVPYSAYKDRITGNVVIKARKMPDNNLRFEIQKSLRPDCDQEALRVVRIVNPKLFLEALNTISEKNFQFIFSQNKNIYYAEKFAVEYFDSNRKAVGEESNDIKWIRRTLLDTINFIPTRIDHIANDGDNKIIVKSDSVKIKLDKQQNLLIYSTVDDYKFGTSPFLGPIYPNKQRLVDVDNPQKIYYSNGNVVSLAEKINLDNDSDSKIIYAWHQNTMPLSIIYSSSINKVRIDKYISVWDSLGTPLVQQGYGHCMLKVTENSEEGDISNGFKTGIWKTINKEGKVLFEDEYNKGQLIKGVNFTLDKSITYKLIEKQAEYDGGMAGLARFLSANLKYPKTAQRDRIAGKVYLQFVVGVKGNIQDVQVIKGLRADCDEEAKRVVELMTDWIPGEQRGIPVRSRFTIPINFAMP
jgi:TonB family protein